MTRWEFFRIHQEIDKLLQFQYQNKWLNEIHKTIFKSLQIELISFGIIHLFIFQFCLVFLSFPCHFSLLRNWLFFFLFYVLNNTNKEHGRNEKNTETSTQNRQIPPKIAIFRLHRKCEMEKMLKFLKHFVLYITQILN